jgi:hypothetical protein
MSVDNRILFVSFVLSFALFGCDKKEDKGGDHIPELKVYTVPAIPTAARQTGLRAEEVDIKYLERFVHLSEVYNVCLDDAAFSGEELTSFQTQLANESGAFASYGLQGVINYSLSTIRKYDQNRDDFSSKVEIRLLLASNDGCHFFVAKSDGSSFPFNELDFAGAQKVILAKGQLQDSSGDINKIPVSYLHADTNGEQIYIDVQYLIGRFIGLANSSENGSYLSAVTTNSSANRGWHAVDSKGKLRLGDDSLILYSFALLYQDILQPEDFETYHHYLDELNLEQGEQDDDLQMPPNASNITFTEVIGDKYIRGARMVGSTIKVCTDNQSGKSISNALISEYFDFVDSDTDDRLGYLLNSIDIDFSPSVQLVTQGCGLLVSFRNSDQYPFANKNYNGMYAHEGRLLDGDGDETTIPVIYLNAENLELDPDEAFGSDARYIGYVLEHEFAHFLGLRHSTSDDSLLSPAGYHDRWDEGGVDHEMFEAYLKNWSQQ